MYNPDRTPQANPPELLREFVSSFDNWYQRIDLGQGVYTMPGEGRTINALEEQIWKDSYNIGFWHWELPVLPQKSVD